MSTSLTNEEKINIVDQHIKSLDYSEYGLQLDLIEIQAVNNPDPGQVTSLNSRISAIATKRAALIAEKDSLTE